MGNQLPLPDEPQTPLNSLIALPEAGELAPSTHQVLGRPAPPISQKVEGMTPSKPIVIESSPMKDLAPKVLPKPGASHPFFAPKGNTAKLKAPQFLQKSKVSAATGWPVPYPDRVSQHVKGAQTIAPPSLSHTPPRSTPSSSAGNLYESSGYTFLAPGLREHNSTSVRGQTITSNLSDGASKRSPPPIPADHLAKHASISRLIDQSLSDTGPQTAGGRSLTEKWRPRCAEEVLGNEASAQYLRNWLRALELQMENPSDALPERPTKRDGKPLPFKNSRKRPRVITEVIRPRYRKRMKTDSDDEDDWIADDDETEEEDAYASSHYTSDFDSDGHLLESSSPMLSTSSIPDTGSDVLPTLPEDPAPDLGELHNTILLVGPPGSGKTAAVYACAEELGWEVFEVYPGIGRRNGANVENLVGEVGKNHIVRQRPHGRHDFFTIGSPSKRKQGLKSKPDADSEYDRSSVALGDHLLDESAQAEEDSPSITQSLILLEEVDILYKEDSRFWETVKDIIRECKRPIICTCNGESLVVDSLFRVFDPLFFRHIFGTFVGTAFATRVGL